MRTTEQQSDDKPKPGRGSPPDKASGQRPEDKPNAKPAKPGGPGDRDRDSDGGQI